jgi:EmrB/QacA subfamily drug resistance transporter
MVTSTSRTRSPRSTTPRPDQRGRPGTILAFTCLAQFLVFLAISVVNLALPSIQRDLGMSDVSVGYVVTAYTTVLGGFLLLGGRLADTYGRRRLLVTGFIGFAVTSLVMALAQNAATLVTARAVQGLAAALITPAALSILTSTFPEGPARNKALGVWGSLAGVASILGVIAGGVLAGGPGWQWIFWLNLAIGLGLAALAPRLVPESRSEQPRQRFDTAGAVALTGGLLLLIFTLGEATHIGWGSVRTVAGLACVAVLLAGFLAIEARADAPIVPLRIFRLRTMRVANLAAVLVFGTFTALFFFASLFMQHVYGYTPVQAGFAYVPLGVAVVVGAGLASSLIAKVAARPVLIAGLVSTVAGLLLLWRAPVGGSYLVDLLPAFLALGLGCGLAYVTLQIAAFAGVDQQEAGVGAGLINTSQEAGGALGLAIVSTIAYSGITSALATAGADATLIRQAQAAANHQAFLAAAGLGLVALLVTVFLMPRPKPIAG